MVVYDTSLPLLLDHTLLQLKSGLIRRVASLEGDSLLNLVIFYSINAFEIWPT
jgi:hypothetical protein